MIDDLVRSSDVGIHFCSGTKVRFTFDAYAGDEAMDGTTTMLASYGPPAPSARTFGPKSQNSTLPAVSV